MAKRERVAIVGSRTWKDKHAIYKIVRELRAGTVVVTGGAKGVDFYAEQEAMDLGFVTVEVKPPWDVHGKAAGPIRNQIIADIADRCIAFWDGRSSGTADVIERFRKAKKDVRILHSMPIKKEK